jgi:hypothetical protein
MQVATQQLPLTIRSRTSCRPKTMTPGIGSKRAAESHERWPRKASSSEALVILPSVYLRLITVAMRWSWPKNVAAMNSRADKEYGVSNTKCKRYLLLGEHWNVENLQLARASELRLEAVG